ncbi:YbaK/prolyl-tRNA synthetase associated domain-containing protein [Campylobacter sp. faydin G-140]|uniref:YbaK/EbsC family protein n=1 Tax=Campylobacter anatolicus TaxID=2829105 RepID=UPI001B9F1734|nr:YbaK/EbsC family protein [Campylobacter anatolicus]MBR8465321.1 YbaK/prolyl-tRNA synthetase associated domain-containing protein [Campylobacter anatolicus]
MSEQIFNKINMMLTQHCARFRVINHEAAGTSQSVAALRGTHVGQGAKALVCTIKGVQKDIVKQKIHILAVLPADYRADLNALCDELGGLKASLSSPSEVSEFTDCVIGSVPPFSFHDELKLVCDPYLFERFEEIAFNAGLLDRSIVLNASDYARIAKPNLIKFAIKN